MSRPSMPSFESASVVCHQARVSTLVISWSRGCPCAKSGGVKLLQTASRQVTKRRKPHGKPDASRATRLSRCHWSRLLRDTASAQARMRGRLGRVILKSESLSSPASSASSASPAAPSRSAPRRRVLSGMRPTGRLHLGNYMGALYNWVHLQREYDCFFFIADLHALTTDYADPSRVKDNIFQITLDFLSAGLDPGRCVIFRQSDVMHHAQLHTLFQHVHTRCPGWSACPATRTSRRSLWIRTSIRMAFLGYPLLQAAGYSALQAGFRAGGRRSGGPCGVDPRSRAAFQRALSRRVFFFPPEAAPWELGAIQEKARKLTVEPKGSMRTTFTPPPVAGSGRNKPRSFHPSVCAKFCRSRRCCSHRAPSCPVPTAARCLKATATSSCFRSLSRSYAPS